MNKEPIQVVARKDHHYGRNAYPAGAVYAARAEDVPYLRLMGLAEPEPTPRRYKRRDLEAQVETVEPLTPGKRRRYKRRDMEADT